MCAKRLVEVNLQALRRVAAARHVFGRASDGAPPRGVRPSPA
jgi:hypothetical protein